MNLRTLKTTDIPFLVSVRTAFPDAWDEKMLLSAFRAGNFFGYVAEETICGAILPTGFITYSVNIDTADLQDLYVAEDCRKKGVGIALVSAFINDAAKMGVKKLFLEVRESNLSAIKLYEKAGFIFLSERKKYYGDGENARVFIKEL